MMGAMEIRVLLFAKLAQACGGKEVVLDLPAGATAGDALDRLAKDYPDLMVIRDRVALAVDMAYVRGDHLLEPGDELALIPPVSGG